ncbi:MAG: TetR/AcrR family transcriptional regulator [Acidimicrobiales bacterium]
MAQSRRPGRPPGPHDDTLAKLLPAAIRLLRDEGVSALSPSRLHVASGVARATIYRNWPEPADIVEALLRHAADDVGDGPDPGSGDGSRGTIEEIDEALELATSRLETPEARALLTVGLDHGLRAATVATAADAYLEGLLRPVRVAVGDAVERGDLTGDTAALVTDIAASMVVEVLVHHRRPDRRRRRRLIEAIVAANRPT